MSLQDPCMSKSKHSLFNIMLIVKVMVKLKLFLKVMVIVLLTLRMMTIGVFILLLFAYFACQITVTRSKHSYCSLI